VSGDFHSQALEAVGAVASIGFFGFMGGYFGSVLFDILARDREVDPLAAGQHASAWVGLIGGWVVFVFVLR
jgi:hypothetical protein